MTTLAQRNAQARTVLRTRVYTPSPNAAALVRQRRHHAAPSDAPPGAGYVLRVCLAILVAGFVVACLMHAAHPGAWFQ